MQHIVSLSGGISSAFAADRVINRYGRDNVKLWFADTNWEDEDLHRFMADCMKRWGGELITYKDGRTPLQVAEHKKIIPNQRRAPCTEVLKIWPFRRFLRKQAKPLTVHLGMDWREQDRMARPKKKYEAIKGVTVDFPLMWEPWIEENYFDIVENEWGIKPARAYANGFTHDNCGGRCIKAGIKHWLTLKKHYPERFAEVRDWETAMRLMDDDRKNYAILRDQSGGKVRAMPLSEIENSWEIVEDTAVRGDSTACFCSY